VGHFLGFGGLIVPSARYDCLNAALFADRINPEAIVIVGDHGAVRRDG
jgi:hypothetical protein